MVADRLAHIGRTLHSRLRDFFEAPLDASASPLEVVQAILEELERRLVPVGRGRRVFPHNRLIVRLAPLQADRAALQAAMAGLEGRFRERLAELECLPPAGLFIHVALLKKAPADWPQDRLFAIDYATEPAVPEPRPAEAPALPTVEIAVLKGSAAQSAYTFGQEVIAIGRTEEPTDDRGRVRHNDVVFNDTADGVTETVGRAHARLQFEPGERVYRLFHEAGSNPTVIVRGGTAIQIPMRDPRGVRVRSGDEIRFGRASVRLTIGRAVG